ncbi:MAG TPA: choice-of-anchor tandem repeat GloVer-containing protein [Verrucomicrobiae bacterium]|nr:choice-of-anchor tandem repeat GloVer-containing protein [Verrucomicrobiae bacterium]
MSIVNRLGISHLLSAALCLALLCLAAPRPAQAQTYTVLHSFTGGVDGAYPHQIIQGSDGNFYGTATWGGANGYGDIFEISPSGVFNVLYSFAGGADGCQPEGPVFRDTNGDIYGTTHECGDPKCRCGVIFKLDTNNILTVLHTFTRATETEGVFPSNNLVSVKGELYGVTESGVLYKITKTGHYTVVHEFNWLYPPGTQSALIRDSAGNIYGDTYYSIYKLDTAGNFSVLYTFTDGVNDGADPAGRLILSSSGTITGASQYTPDPNRCGLVFRLEADGTLKALHHFEPGTSGCAPATGLIDMNGTIYGTTTEGGDEACLTSYQPHSCGVLYQISKTGVYTVVHSWNGADGASPQDELTKGNDGNVYGITKSGGIYTGYCVDSDGCGVIFRYTP